MKRTATENNLKEAASEILKHFQGASEKITTTTLEAKEMKNSAIKFHQQVARTLAVLDAVANSETDVELDLVLFYGVESAFRELKAVSGMAGIDTETEVGTWGALAALDIFCRLTRHLLDQGMDPQELRSKVDPQDQFRFFCEMCADSLRRVLEMGENNLKQAA